MALSHEKVASLSEGVMSNLLSGDSQLVKTAALGASEYFKHEIRENGVLRKRLPPEQVSDDRLETAGDTDWPTVKIPVAPTSPGAYVVPFETGPKNNVLHTRSVMVEFNRIMTDRFEIDKIRMKTWQIPVLDIFNDLMLKDIMDSEDIMFTSMEREVVGEVNKFANDLGICRHVTCGSLQGEKFRPALTHMMKAMACLPTNLQLTKVVMNNLTYTDFNSLGREYIGGDMAQDNLINGFSSQKLLGYDVITTTKKEVVKPGEVWCYTDPEYYGCFLTLEDVSLVSEEKDNIWLKFFAHETVGGAIVNPYAVALCEMSGDPWDWDKEKSDSESESA